MHSYISPQEMIAMPVIGMNRVLASFGENDYVRKAAEWGAQGGLMADTSTHDT